MKISKLLIFFVFFCCVLSTRANAWFFFFLPLGGGPTANPNEKCVTTAAQVGGLITIDNNNFLIKSIVGSSNKCTNSAYPILAVTEPATGDIAQRASNVKLDFPDGWEQKPLTNQMKVGGGIAYLTNRTLDAGTMLYTADRKGVTDMESYVASKKNSLSGALENQATSDTVKFQVNGLSAWQYVRTGKLKNKVEVTYLNTFIDSTTEIILITQWTTTGNFPRIQDQLQQIIRTISGVTAKTVAPDSINIRSTNDKTSNSSEDVATKLQTLKNLLNKGLINKEDYEVKKAEVLRNM